MFRKNIDVKIVDAKARKGSNSCCPRSACLQPAAAAARQHSAGACASAVPAAAGRRSACSRLAAGGAGSPRVEAPAAAEPAGRGAAGQQRGLRHRRAAAPVAAAPTGKNPAGAAASEAAPPAGADSRAEPPAEAAAPEEGAHPQRHRRQRACRLQARAVPSPRRTGSAGRVAATEAAEGIRVLGKKTVLPL